MTVPDDDLAQAFADLGPPPPRAAGLSVALACAARGWFVFPCGPDKQPLTRHGFKDAATDPGAVRALWANCPQASVGVATGASGLVVIDLDCKNGQPGLDEWHKIVADSREPLEATTLVETPSGGMHVYFRANGHRVTSSAGRLAPGIDTRAEGGYVIAGGSPGYLYVDDHGPERLASLPPGLGEKLAYAKRRNGDEKPAGQIPEGRRDSTLASLAGTMRRRGLSEDAIYAALAAENKASCRPPLPDAQVRKIAGSVGRYEPARPAWEPEEDPAPEPTIGHRDRIFIDWSTFWDRDRSEAEWVYPDVLARGRGHALYAVHKTGKSLLMLYLAAEIATGPDPSVVVYLDYEMTEVDVFDRLDDMGYGPGTDFSRLRYALLPTLPPLDTAAGAEALTELVDGVQSEWPEHHVVVVIDTISRAVRGKENDADTFRDFYFHTGIRLKRRGITWARLDHGGKSPEQGQRGSSSKGDDVDVVWKLTKTQNGVNLHRELSRMEWVPENVVLGRFDDPLRYQRLAGDWPDGTGEVANLLDRLNIPLDASAREAGAALKTVDEPRRRQAVLAALRWRREKDSLGSSGGFREPPRNPGTPSFPLLPEPHRNPPLFEAGNPLGTPGTPTPVQMVGGKEDPLKGGLLSPPSSTTENHPLDILMDDMP